MIKVAIVDDHKLFRKGLASMLSLYEDIKVKAKFESAEDLLLKLDSLKVKVILLDIDMDGMSGIEAIPLIKAKRPEIKIVMLSMHLKATKIEQALVAGADGYMLKSSDDVEVAQAIRDVVEGKGVMAKEAQEEIDEVIRKKKDPAVKHLTKREKQIIKMVCQEKNSQEIAKTLQVSLFTVETHRRNILNKTGCKNSIGLVRYAIEKGLID